MCHPTEITDAWVELMQGEPSEDMRILASVLEEAGLKVSFVGGVLYADDADRDRDGQWFDRASFRIEQVA